MSRDLVFRKLSIEALPAIMEVERQGKSLPWSAAMVRDSLRARHLQVWGAFDMPANVLVGFAVLSVVSDEAELLAMTIAAHLRRQGIGNRLLDFLLDQARACHARQLFLEVRQTNFPAIGLYRKLGFDYAGRRKGYYPVLTRQDREDALLMSVALVKEDVKAFAS